MKPLLNPDKRRYIAWEDSYSLHQLIARNDDERFYITKCNRPIAFEENYQTFNYVTPYRWVCKICGPIT